MEWLLWLLAMFVGSGQNIPHNLSVAVTGDVLLARSVNERMVREDNFNYPWENTAEKLRQADVTFVNLETPLTSDCRPRKDGMIFCGDIRGMGGLKFAGVDVVNLANNHMCNFGRIGLDQTKAGLQKAGIYWTGTGDGEPVIEVGNKKIGFLGFTDLGNTACGINSTAGMEDKVKDLKKKADWVVVQFHWGVEYTDKPTKRQVELAHRAIDAGADLVVGNHPHWVQTTEKYKDGIITYSHGNFIFDQTWSKKTMEGVVGWYEFEGASVSAKFLPVNTSSDLQTRWTN